MVNMHYSISENVIAYSVGTDEFVLYNADKEELIVLNEEGRILWESLSDDNALLELIKTSGFAEEINSVLHSLEEKGYIKREE